ncbi:IMS domain-containing protein [Chroococcus sp. FPU101]|uniref:IMS domain-containing protein n=1 Tax=Chroococcus sp. FPU101 TaxID=1974212 RepID=UPI001A8CA9A8|nr:IMS domain-containing protein [Chroococcus sp. FPU101]GFE70807.1 heat shock protein DnaJ domain protein [Chroococcus sp. FPU101]
MQIPLDYYRILGVSIQATHEQLQQAYDDRSLQLPRREYGLAIASRQQLLDQAYHILADPDKRAAYNADFLKQNTEFLINTESLVEDFAIHSIEIQPEQLDGALLILHELGEYELVIRLGESQINGTSEAINQQRQEIIFTLALAYLELSREHWEQQDYEAAATIAQKGLKLLTQEKLFPQLQAEILAEYNKLRPYRILNFISEDLAKAKERSQGLQLLQEMLQERQGIDGLGNDGSGLNSHRFLLYLQQLRPYLTLNEQLTVFETVSRPSSAVDACLNVYILIAKGFAHKRPNCILKATSLLDQLNKHQDVYLEQAICALLLGLTELANITVEKTQETAVLNEIREHSKDSPDLIPGLYQYTEKWLQTEVYRQFRDLKQEQVSLKDYFGDENVQKTLEDVSKTTKWEDLSSESNNIEDESYITVHPKEENDNLISITGEIAMRKSALSEYQYLPEPNFPQRDRGKRKSTSSTSKTTRTNRRIEGRTVGYTDNNFASPNYPQSEPSRYQEKKTSLIEKPDSLNTKNPRFKKKTRSKRRKFQPFKLLLLGIGLLGGLSLSVLALKAISDSQSPLAALQGEQLAISLNQPPLEFPLANAQAVLSEALTAEGAKEVIQTWLNSKSQAFGPEYQIEQLKNILAEPLFLEWQKRAIALKAQNSYWKYQHQLEIQSVMTDAQNPEHATVAAKVRETAQFNQNGKIVASRSYDQNLSVRYDLAQHKGQWLIQNITVLN